MRKSTLFIITMLSGALALGAEAGPLGGGLGGHLGGGLGLGGLSGSLDGSIGGRLNADPDLTPAEQAATDAHAKARADAKRAAKAVAAPPVTANVAAAVSTHVTSPAVGTASRDIRSATSLPSPVALATPVVGVTPIEARVIRERQGTALYEGGVTVLSAPESYLYMDRQADALRRELAGTGVEVTRQGENIVLEMPSDVTFAFNKSDIRPRFYTALDAVARTLNDYPATYVDVIGHTDAIGSVPYNQTLSERRAESVASFIQDHEQIPARLYVAGRGKFEPVASNATIEGRAANRRVEILLHPYTRGS